MRRTLRTDLPNVRISVPKDLPDSVIVDAIVAFYHEGLNSRKRIEITEPETIETQRELRDMVQ